MLSKRSPAILAALAVLASAGCATTAESGTASDPSIDPSSPPVEPEPEVAPAAPVRIAPNPRYTLRPGDEIEVKFTYHPQFNERMEILPDGYITLPLVHEVAAAGKAPAELSRTLRELYGRELKDPDIFVVVRRATGALAYIGGEVRTPQMIPLATPTTLLQAIVRSGDVLGSARSQVLVLRVSPDGTVRPLTANLGRIRAGKDPDLMLQAYDVVHVPKTAIAHVGDFVDAYINRIIPRAVSASFPFVYELHSETREVLVQPPSTSP